MSEVDPCSEVARRRVLVIDCGSTALRGSIAETSVGGEWSLLEELCFPVDLSGVFLVGRLRRESMDRVVRGVADLLAAGRSYAVDFVRSVGTSALREAENADVLLERLHRSHDIEVEVLDGAEEARLYSAALGLLRGGAGPLTGSDLLLDLGSGGTSVALMRDGVLVQATNEHFGTERLLQDFGQLRDSADFGVSVDRVALGAARMILGRLGEVCPDRLLVSGEELRQLLGLIGGADDSREPGLPLARLEEWFARMRGLTGAGRAQACEVDRSQGDRLLLAAALTRHLAGRLGHEVVRVPRLSLRHGLIADCMPGSPGARHLPREHLLASARALCERFGGDINYHDNTSRLAAQIFDQTQVLHGLGPRERTLLEFAAWLHDIGSFVNVRSRHKHSAYLIRAIDIAGLSAVEKDLVAHIVRYHRRSLPRLQHLEFQALPRQQRVLVSHLAAILRLAYGLDVERDQRVRKVRCEVTKGRLMLRLDRRQIGLERWSLADKAHMFAAVFGLEVVVSGREDV